MNDYIPYYIAKTLVKKLIDSDKNPGKCKVLVKGITFKENVSDIRNSKVVDLVRELMSYSIIVHIEDPYASPNELAHEYQLSLITNLDDDYDAVVIAVKHDQFQILSESDYISLFKDTAIVFDLKRTKPSLRQDSAITYWTL